jgi:hypothetical protein
MGCGITRSGRIRRDCAASSGPVRDSAPVLALSFRGRRQAGPHRKEATMERRDTLALGPIVLGVALLQAVLIALALGLGGEGDEHGLGPEPPAIMAEGAAAR